MSFFSTESPCSFPKPKRIVTHNFGNAGSHSIDIALYWQHGFLFVEDSGTCKCTDVERDEKLSKHVSFSCVFLVCIFFFLIQSFLLIFTSVISYLQMKKYFL